MVVTLKLNQAPAPQLRFQNCPPVCMFHTLLLSAASCLQTDLLLKWRKPSICAFVSRKERRIASLPGGTQLGLSTDQAKRILFKKIRFPRLFSLSFYSCVLFEDRHGLTTSGPERQVCSLDYYDF